jgi:hypothetical protein
MIGAAVAPMIIADDAFRRAISTFCASVTELIALELMQILVHVQLS